MDYYYALLNSYSLLKKRQFKLSIHEQEEEGSDEEKTKEQVAQVIAAAGDSKDANKQLGGVLLYKDTLDGVPNSDDIMARDFADKDDPKSQSAQVVKGGVKNEKMKPIGHTFWSMMFPGEEAPQDEPSAEDDDAVEFQVAPEEEKRREALAETQAARDALGKELSEILEELGIEFDPLTLETQVENTAEYTSIPAKVISATLEGIASLLRLGKKVKKRRGEYDTPEGLIKLGKEYEALIEKYKMTTDPVTGEVMFDTVSLARGDGEPLTDEQLQRVIKDLKRLKELSDKLLGIASEFPDIPEEFDERTEGLQDLRGVAVENLEVFTSQQHECWGMGENSPERDECTKKLHGKIVFALDERTRWEEKVKECNEKSTNTVDEVIAKIECVEQANRMPQGISLPELVNVFRVGLLAKEDRILLDKEGKMSAATVKWVIKRLQETAGMTEDQAWDYVREVAGLDGATLTPKTDGNGLKALLLMSAITRHFAQQINGDMTPTIVLPMGQGQETKSNIIGAKVDVAKGYCPGVGKYEGMNATQVKKALVDHVRDNLLSKEQIEHYTKDCNTGKPIDKGKRKAAINKIIGNNLIGKPQEIKEPSTTDENGEEKAGDVLCKGYKIQTDPKTHENEGKHSTLGQTSGGKQDEAFKQLCNEENNLDKNEKKRMKQVTGTLDNCTGKKTVTDACKFKEKIDDTVKDIEELLTPGSRGVKNVTKPEKAIMQSWVDSKSEGIERRNAQMRMDAAVRCMENYTQVGKKLEAKIDKETGKAYEEDMTAMEKSGKGSYKEKSDCDHLTSIKSSIRNRQVAALLDGPENVEASSGKLKGEALAYFQTMYLVTGGSNGEIMQDKRGMEDNVQETMMRNAEQEANLKGTDFVRSCAKWKPGTKECAEWSQKVALIEKGKPFPGPGRNTPNRANISFDRETTKVRTGTDPAIYNKISPDESADNNKATEKKPTGESSNLFKDYLEGQQRLLEALLNQTTKNPNT